MNPENREQYVFTKKRSFLDPRTKLILLILTALFCLGGAGGKRMTVFSCFLTILPYALFILEKQWKKETAHFAVLALCWFYLLFVHEHMSDGGGFERACSFVLLLTASVFTRLLPSLEMGSYAISTTTVSQFAAAMEAVHMPEEITIPMSVMFRFVPGVIENSGAIRESASMRGIHAAGLLKKLEYQLVPLVECTTSIGENLSASALMRGLGSPVKRTSISFTGFHAPDWTVLLLTAVVFTVSLVAGA